MHTKNVIPINVHKIIYIKSFMLKFFIFSKYLLDYFIISYKFFSIFSHFKALRVSKILFLNKVV